MHKDVGIPEPQNSKSARSQKYVPPHVVVDLFNMLAAIQLDDYGRFQTSKITYVRPDGMLATELETIKLAASQMSPKQPFSVSGIAAEIEGISQHNIIE